MRLPTEITGGFLSPERGNVMTIKKRIAIVRGRNMRRFFSVFAVSGILFLLPASPVYCEAVTVWGVNVVEHGIYVAQMQQGEKIEQALGGRQRIVGQMHFLEETYKIPAVLGTRFGFTYTINGMPKQSVVPIKIIKRHPGLKDPEKGQEVVSQEYVTQQKIGEVCGTGYGFDHSWELVPGKWTFEISYEDNILVDISFDVYKP